MKLDAKSTIETGKAILGIELGSTRIKAVLIDQENKPIAQGSHTWENQLVNGLWTYSIDAIWSGLQDCYADLRSNVKKLYDTEIETLAAIGVSAMMHGYMPFNEKEEILVPFRTWRNTNTGRAAAELSELFVYNIPLRWSISHLYQAILDNASGYLWTAAYVNETGDAAADILSDIAAEQRAKVVYQNLYRQIDDKGVRETIDFLLNREEAHNTMFREAFNRIQDTGSQQDWGATVDSRIYFDLSHPGGQSFDPAKRQPPSFNL